MATPAQEGIAVSPAMAALSPGGRAQLTLERLHAEAGGDWHRLPLAMIKDTWGRLRGETGPAAMSRNWRDVYVPLGPAAGRFCYQLALSREADVIVEFGTSMAISTLYLAAAAAERGRGIVIGTELDENKAARAASHIDEAGLNRWVDLRVGDARETLRDLPGPIDLLLLDGWKDLYLPLLLQLEPALAPGAVVLADNIYIFRRALKPFMEHIRRPGSGYSSVVLPLGTGLMYATRGCADRNPG